MTSPSKFEQEARRLGWKTADLTPNAAVNEFLIDPNTKQCAFFHAPDGFDLWESLCIAWDIDAR